MMMVSVGAISLRFSKVEEKHSSHRRMAAAEKFASVSWESCLYQKKPDWSITCDIFGVFVVIIL